LTGCKKAEWAETVIFVVLNPSMLGILDCASLEVCGRLLH